MQKNKSVMDLEELNAAKKDQSVKELANQQ